MIDWGLLCWVVVVVDIDIKIMNVVYHLCCSCETDSDTKNFFEPLHRCTLEKTVTLCCYPKNEPAF